MKEANTLKELITKYNHIRRSVIEGNIHQSKEQEEYLLTKIKKLSKEENCKIVYLKTAVYDQLILKK